MSDTLTSAHDMTKPSFGPLPEEGFHVHLKNFQGPFDLLLSLIAKHKLDITEVALAQVTDEFIAYLRASTDDPQTGEAYLGGDSSKNLGIASEFLLVAATLLDLKAARLLPQPDLEDEDSIELLEARDLLFAKLLQYRAFKELAAVFAERMERQSHYVPRSVSLEPRFARALPPLVWNLDANKLSDLARRALGLTEQAPPPIVKVEHLHDSRISIEDEIPFVLSFFARNPRTTFEALVGDATEPLQVVVRFLIMLEMYRDNAISFAQPEPLGVLDLIYLSDASYRPRFSDDYVADAQYVESQRANLGE